MGAHNHLAPEFKEMLKLFLRDKMQDMRHNRGVSDRLETLFAKVDDMEVGSKSDLALKLLELNLAVRD